jgi:hypothetical protein
MSHGKLAGMIDAVSELPRRSRWLAYNACNDAIRSVGVPANHWLWTRLYDAEARLP